MTPHTLDRTITTCATSAESPIGRAQQIQRSTLQAILGLKIANHQDRTLTPARRVRVVLIHSRLNFRREKTMYKVITLKDKSIPSRRQRRDREEAQTTSELIRTALQAGNATKVVQEADREQ